jgi:hypothetical protein
MQRNAGIFRVRQTVQSTSAGLYPRSHGSLGQPVFFHCGLDLIGKDLLNRKLLALAKNAFIAGKIVERTAVARSP